MSRSGKPEEETGGKRSKASVLGAEAKSDQGPREAGQAVWNLTEKRNGKPWMCFKENPKLILKSRLLWERGRIELGKSQEVHNVYNDDDVLGDKDSDDVNSDDFGAATKKWEV